MPDKPASKFNVPYLSGKYIVPALFLLAVLLLLVYSPSHFASLFTLEGLPMLLFWIVISILSVLSFIRNFSLIPVLGLVSCFYLMAQESYTNWLRFVIWLLVGLVIYFLYSRGHSKLNPKRLK
jgi:Ca2+/Na+ antiporter